MHTALTTVPQPAALPIIDEQKLYELLGRAIVDFGGADIAPLVVIGDRLGLFRALATAGPLTSAGLASETGTAERYVREWLNAQAASGYVTYHPESGRYSLTPEQAMAFADEDGPAFIVGAFQTAVAAGRIVDKLTEAFRTGEGIGWHEHDHALFHGVERFFRSSYRRQPDPGVDSGPRRRGSAAAGRRARRRHRLRPRRLDHHHGAGLSEVALRRLRLASGLDRRRQRPRAARPGSRTAAGSRSPGPRTSRARLRPRHGLRRAARHGRSGRRGAPRPVDARAGRQLDDRRAVRRRSRRGEPQSGRPRLLRGLDADLHAVLAGAGGRARARRPGGRGAAARGGAGRRLHDVPARRRSRRSTWCSRRDPEPRLPPRAQPGRSPRRSPGHEPGYEARIAITRSGAPLPPAIFIGSAMTWAPRAGSRSSEARFSNAGMSFAKSARCDSNSVDWP